MCRAAVLSLRLLSHQSLFCHTPTSTGWGEPGDCTGYSTTVLSSQTVESRQWSHEHVEIRYLKFSSTDAQTMFVRGWPLFHESFCKARAGRAILSPLWGFSVIFFRDGVTHFPEFGLPFPLWRIPTVYTVSCLTTEKSDTFQHYRTLWAVVLSSGLWLSNGSTTGTQEITCSLVVWDNTPAKREASWRKAWMVCRKSPEPGGDSDRATPHQDCSSFAKLVEKRFGWSGCWGPGSSSSLLLRT